MTSEHNPLTALNQALTEQLMGGAEKSALEVVSRALGLPLALVHRVVFAYVHLENETWPHHFIGSLSPHVSWEEIIGNDEVRESIQRRVAAGVKRYLVRHAIENQKKILVTTGALINDAMQICNGCPIRLECIAQSLRTPNECIKGGLDVVLARPLSMKNGNVVVVAEQPAGQYTIPLSAIRHRKI